MDASSQLTPRDLWNTAVRRKWLIFGAILLSLAVAATLCKMLPKSYRSDTLILVEDQKIPESYVKGLVGGSVQERITMIQQQVMSRTLLGQVVEEFKLNEGNTNPKALEALIGKLRDSIDVSTVGTGGRRGSVEAFRVSFSHENPVTAMKVTARIASKFIEENLKHREQFVEGASEFLDQELRRAEGELEQKERAISAFKTKHMGQLPEQTEANLRTLDRLQNELFRINESIQPLSDKIEEVERGITEYSETGELTPGLAAGTGESGRLFRRLQELKEKLAALSAEYKDTYPDVILTKQQIERIEAQLEKEYGEQTDSKDETHLDPYLRRLHEKRDGLKRETAYLKEAQRRLIQRTKEYEKRVEQSPKLEQQMLILRRDYENMKSNYSSLLNKRLNAGIAGNLERRQKGERFRIMDPANVPAKPYKPNQERIMLLGLAVGCALGFGMAYLLEMLNPTFRRPEDLEVFLGIHVLAAIPDFGILYGQSAKQRLLGHVHAAVPADIRAVTVQAKGNVKPETRQRRHWPMSGANGHRFPLEMGLVAKWRPTSIVAEQYRVAATRLSLLEGGRSSPVVVVTSAVKGEGKTTTVVNLGYTLARDLGKRTLLVDCDFKCPVLHRYADISSEPGLTDLLNEGTSFERSISSFGDIPCWVLPAGSRRTRVNELSKTQQLATILTGLRAQFEYILINTPPILPLADMNVLAGLADVLVLVVRAGSTPQQVVQRAINTLRVTTQAQVILNAVEAQTRPYYMRYDYHVRSAEEQHV